MPAALLADVAEQAGQAAVDREFGELVGGAAHERLRHRGEDRGRCHGDELELPVKVVHHGVGGRRVEQADEARLARALVSQVVVSVVAEWSGHGGLEPQAERGPAPEHDFQREVFDVLVVAAVVAAVIRHGAIGLCVDVERVEAGRQVVPERLDAHLGLAEGVDEGHEFEGFEH